MDTPGERTMKYMKKTFMIIILLLIVSTIWPVDQVNLWDKRVIQDTITGLDGSAIITEKGTVIEIDDISYLALDIPAETRQQQESEQLSSISDSELQKRARTMSARYPDASSVILIDEGIQKLRKDGTRYSLSRYALKIMNEKDLSRAILTFYEKGEDYRTWILTARSIAPDGSITTLSEDDISYTTPTQGLQFFSGKRDVRYLKAEIPNVTVGSIIDYTWESIESAPEDSNQYYASWFFGGSDPVFESTCTVVIPTEKELYYTSLNFSPYSDKPTVTKGSGYQRYRFTRGENKPLETEPQSPPDGELIPWIRTSLHKNQDYLSDWLAGFMLERMKIDKEIKNDVNQYLKQKQVTGEEQIIAELYRYMQDRIQYRSIKTSLSSGFSGHPAVETFTKGYGDCIDKSILFASILNDRGIEAYPVIVMTNDEAQPPYGKIGLVAGNHAINEIHLKDGSIIYLDSTSSTYRYPAFRSDDQGIKAWNAIKNTIRYIEPLPPIYNTQEFSSDITLNVNGSGTFKQHRVYSGSWEAGLRNYFLQIKENEIERLIRSVIAGDYPGATLTSYSYSDPRDYSSNFTLTMEFSAENVTSSIGSKRVFNFPFHYGFDYLALETRNHPLQFSTVEGLKHNISVKLAEGYSIDTVPQPLKISNDTIQYSGDYKIDGSTVTFSDHFVRSRIRVTPDSYTNFRSNLLEIEHFASIPVLINNDGDR
jgi:transglutaminase-like putative cysteine protease